MAKIKCITTSSESIGRKKSSNDMPVSNCIQKVFEGMITFTQCEHIFIAIDNINQYNNNNTQ